MEFHQPYSHQTRFKVVRSTTRLIQRPKSKTTPFSLVRTPNKTVKPSSTTPTATTMTNTVVKNIGNKYRWIRTNSKKTDSHSFKLDRRKLPTVNGRVNKRKIRASLSKCLVQIRGVKFHTNRNGKCLQRLASDSGDQPKVVPVKDPIRARASVLLHRSIQISNGRYRLTNAKRKSASNLKTTNKKRNCIYFNRFGKCHRGDQCPFIHDRSRIAVCTQFLNGRCKNSSCPYLHELIPGKVPTCSYFIKGACGQDNCPYAHSYVGHDAQICEDFVQGFCSKGIECSKKHVLLCPEFESKGQCSRGKQCHLTHRRKRNETADVMKKKSDLPKTSENKTSESSVMPAYIPLTQG